MTNNKKKTAQRWQPPFSQSSDPAVRRAFAEFTARKGAEPYSMGDAIAHLERRVPQRAGSSDNTEVHPSAWRMTLARFLREMRQ
jgi:hypothetical protein